MPSGDIELYDGRHPGLRVLTGSKKDESVKLSQMQRPPKELMSQVKPIVVAFDHSPIVMKRSASQNQ